MPGNALSDNVKVTSASRHIENGTQIGNDVNNDPLEELYWTTGVELTPPLEKFVTNAMTTEFTVADIESQTYTGEELTPSILVQNGETTLVEGTDYFITYKNTDGTDSDGKFINAGSYVVTVTGIGDYYGTIEKTFTILPKEFTFDTSLDSDSASYDGTSKTPSLTVKDGEIVLTENVDYTVSYTYGENLEAKDFSNAEFIEAGNYKLVITGIGNYAGSTAEAVFAINNKNGTPTTGNNSNNNNSTTTKNNNTSTVAGTSSGTTTSGSKAATNQTSTDKTASTATTSPKTGDNTNIVLWLSLFAVSCITFTGVTLVKKKSKKNQK